MSTNPRVAAEVTRRTFAPEDAESASLRRRLRGCHLVWWRFSILFALLGALCLQVSLGHAASLVDFARQQVGITTAYDPTYRKLPYPGGDVPIQTGVCCDVVVRSFRGLKLDLQKEVHEDMARAFAEYPQKWGLKRPDANIDHRRVPNLMTFFQRKGWGLEPSQKASDYFPGDVVTWDLGGGITHIGIVSDRKAASGTPLVIHNIGGGAQEEDVLLKFKVIGHYRPKIMP